MTITATDTEIPARDGYALSATVYAPQEQSPHPAVVVVSSAVAVPRQLYRRFAETLVGGGYTVVTYDYRGIGGSKPESLRGFDADCSDWVFQDMAGVIDWVKSEFEPGRLFLIGHSFGGQVAGMLDNVDHLAGLITFSSQSGHWRHQNGMQKAAVATVGYITIPVLTPLFGYAPWGKLGGGEDLPAGVAKQWGSWVRKPGYLFDDPTLPLDQFDSFSAPVLAYSIDDDDWGNSESVDLLMHRAYQNVERRHIVPADRSIAEIGHVGYFRESSSVLWPEVIAWMDQQSDEAS
ncbi:MAG: alpha/beta hydrolase family protein [Acidimicrobiia bacterium]